MRKDGIRSTMRKIGSVLAMLTVLALLPARVSRLLYPATNPDTGLLLACTQADGLLPEGVITQVPDTPRTSEGSRGRHPRSFARRG
jgi:hypothetical protein